MSLTKTADPAWTAPVLNQATLRRIVVALIVEAQLNLHKRGLVQEDQTLAARALILDDAALDAVSIDEQTLGFDSLTRLELINRVNQFFQLTQSGAEDYLLIMPTIGRWIETIQQHFQLVGTELSFGFATSGSAGPPRVHQHSLSDLTKEIEVQHRGPLSEFETSGRIISLVPPQHIYGFLFTCLLPSLKGIEVLDLHAKAPSAAARSARPGDLVVGTPFAWEMVANAGVPFSDGVIGLTSAGPSTRGTWETGPCHPDQMIEIYGSTETAGLAWRTAWNAPFQLLPHLERKGEVITRITARDELLPVQDRLRWLDHGKFDLDGRLDHVVQIAGVNISPSHIAKLIGGVPGVADVAVRLGQERLKCFVVARDSKSTQHELERVIRGHLKANLPASARPSSLTFGTALPRSEIGKLCDWP